MSLAPDARRRARREAGGMTSASATAPALSAATALSTAHRLSVPSGASSATTVLSEGFCSSFSLVR